MVAAAAAVASVVGQSPFTNVPNTAIPGLNAINAPEVWARGYTGQGIVVAVVDTGVDYFHDDLDDNIWSNTREIADNGIDDDSNGFVDDIRGWDFVNNDNSPFDIDGHGTHVAGTIAAENNGFGVTGVAYDAQIMPVKVLDEYSDAFTTDLNIAAGIIYAVDNGADVINLSLGRPVTDLFTSVLGEEAIRYAADRGVVVVMSAGNDSLNQPDWSARYADEFGIAVGAVDSNNTLADFSNRAGTIALDYVVAPGVDVYSTIPFDSYDFSDGTSMAAPHVAGVAALMLSANPYLTPTQVESILTATANPTGIT